MSDEINVASHTVSAGGGAVLAMILDRLIRFFTERDRREAEQKTGERLASIEAKLDSLKGREELVAMLARLEGRLEAMERHRE